jgi:hypothetical protein
VNRQPPPPESVAEDYSLSFVAANLLALPIGAV